MSVLKSTYILGMCGLLAGAMALDARAATYNESIQGDLSGVPASPTMWALTVGANTLSGSAGNMNTAPFTADYDLVTFTVPAGNKLNSIIVNSLIMASEGDAAFFAIQPGSPWMDGVGYEMSGANLFGWVTAGASDAGTDLLFYINQEPLDAGVYTFVSQDVDATFQYSLTFNVASAVTLPADFDGNHVVNGNDLTQWRGDFGLNGDSDADGDHDSDGQDFLVWQQTFGAGSPVASIPEPSGAFLAICAAGHCLTAVRRRRRQSFQA